MNMVNVIASDSFQSLSHRCLQDDNMIADCVKKEDVSQLNNTELSN